jgi:hypothetical protein
VTAPHCSPLSALFTDTDGTCAVAPAPLFTTSRNGAAVTRKEKQKKKEKYKELEKSM